MSQQKTEQKIEQFWRDATAEDISRMMKGENVNARFRDKNSHEWTASGELLAGYDSTEESKWIDDTGCPWRLCQVYDPPQWYLDKPDPGEGFRLLEKFPSEPKLATDDFWSNLDKKWKLVASGSGLQEHGVWYRRRIEPKEVESRSKDYIPNGWVKVPDDEPRLASDAYWSQGASEWCLIGDNRVEYANRDKWPAIRQRKFVLAQGESHRLPNGLTLKVYKQGFEVL